MPSLPHEPLGLIHRGYGFRLVQDTHTKPGERLGVVFLRLAGELEPVAMSERELREIPLPTVRQPYRGIETFGAIVTALTKPDDVR